MIRIDLGGVGLSSSACIESNLHAAKIQAVLYQYTRDLVEDRAHFLDILEGTLESIVATGKSTLMVDVEALDDALGSTNGDSDYNMGQFTVKETNLLKRVLAEAQRLQCVDILFY